MSSYDNSERLAKFASWVEGDDLLVDLDEIAQWEKEHPQPFDRDMAHLTDISFGGVRL